jgi:histidinol-phosphate aminotransferase
MSDDTMVGDVDLRVAQLVRSEVRELSAYHVPDASGMIKLDAMENPFTWPPELIEEWQQVQSGVAVNRYPDPAAVSVKAALRTVFDVPEQLDILLGNGSDEIIQLLAMALATPGAVLLSPEPGFAMYRMIARFTGMDYVGVDLGPDWQIDLPAMLEAISVHQPALVFLALPNNPTGNLFSEEDVRAIVEATPGVVVLDEAYTAFTEADYLSWAAAYDNVLVMRTLSKVGLAGLRLGMLFGVPAWLAELEKLRLPYNTGVLTQVTAEFALRHFATFDQQTAELRYQRSWLFDQLQGMEGVSVFPSEANFLVVRLQTMTAKEAWEGLRQRGVLVKNLEGSHPSLAACLRVTVSSRSENQAFLAAIAEVLA